MLYGKKIEPKCAYCIPAEKIDDTYFFCRRHGPVEWNYKCRRFKYDPLMRDIPRRHRRKRVFTKEDFDLNL